MKRILLQYAAGIMAASVLFSCSFEEEQATFADNYKETAEVSEYCYISVADTIQYYTRTKNAGITERLNDEIVSLCFGEQFRGMTVEESYNAELDSLKADWWTNAVSLAENADSPVFSCAYEFITVGSFSSQYKNLQSYSAFKYSFMGGAHGFAGTYYMILDTAEGKRIEESDLFSQGYKEPVSELIFMALIKEYPDMEEEFNGFNDFSEVKSSEDNPYINGNCRVSEEGVTWIFNPYEIASYAAGHFEVTIPWEDLKPYINSEVLEL